MTLVSDTPEPKLPTRRAPTMAQLERMLEERFGLKGFRPWQREAIEAVLPTSSRVLVVAPTGGGKSLTYQFPATVLPGVCVVISPLVALMEDQVRSLEARGISATYLASNLTASVRAARERGLREGQYKLIYVSPERLAFDSAIDQLARLKPSLVAIDEAHCISQWGHDFRPDYARLGEVLTRLNPPRVLACTATATPHVRRDIRESLRFEPERTVEILRGFARPNLHFEASSVEGPTEARKLMEDALSARLGSPAKPRGGAIIYAATRKITEKLSERLTSRGWNSAAYHAGLDAALRTKVSARFAAKDIDVVVATNAFGMGIDRPDIRLVVHAQPPTSIEAYYQEVGRAGRDGADAYGLLLCSGQDIALRRRLVELGPDGERADELSIARNWRLFRELLRYLDAGTCRHDFVLRYFGDEREVLGGCGHCDICASLDELENEQDAKIVTATVRKALAGVARANKRAGLTSVAEMLRGVSNVKTERFGFTRLTTFGLFRDRPQAWVLSLLRGLLTAGWVDLSTGDYPLPFVTKSGWKTMTTEEPLRFRLPIERRKLSKTARKASDGATGLSADDAALLERLRTWRAGVAKSREVPAYVIALDKTLLEIATRRPRTLQALPAIFGLGPSRIELFGEELVRIVTGNR
ncbi:MAG: ATP-dependent DNA helicase RecQ [Deltaproteobacteria bacterium]|nr:ATP-dependent DNA helicase RecQ [Deltaproteobacteria bacterium]